MSAGRWCAQHASAHHGALVSPQVRHERWPVAMAAATALGKFGSAAPLPLPDGVVLSAVEETVGEEGDGKGHAGTGDAGTGDAGKKADGTADGAQPMDGIVSTAHDSATAHGSANAHQSAPEASGAASTTTAAPSASVSSDASTATAAPTASVSSEASKPPPPVRKQPEPPSTKVEAPLIACFIYSASPPADGQ